MLLSSLIPLSACGTTKVVYRDHYVVIQPDGHLRDHADKPAKPTLKTPNDVAQLIADLYAWGESLEGTLNAMWKSIDEGTAEVEKQNQ